MTLLESFGSIEVPSLRPDVQGVSNALAGLHDSFESSISTVSDAFDSAGSAINEGIARFTGIENESQLLEIQPGVMEQVDIMLNGFVTVDGAQTLGLNDLNDWILNPEYKSQNLRQQAGYAAEIISTAKENMIALAEGSELTTFRADDRPDLGFSKNDQYVDKVRVNASGEVVERIQTKFVGDNGSDWVKRMMTKKFEKFLTTDLVDKIECPSDYFDDAKAYIAQRKNELGSQLERVTADGKADVAESIQARIDKLNKLDDMIEQSTVTMKDALDARKHPKRFVAKLLAPDMIKASVREGAFGAVSAAGLTFITSTVLHGTELYRGEISAEEMAKEVATEAGAAGAIGGATSFISATVANTMQASSSSLISSIGGSCLPASAVTFAVESYDSVVDYAQGVIGADELAYDLGHNAATIAGGAVAGGQAGAAAGAVLGPVGGAAGGIIGGLVGSAVASGAYETAMEYAPETAQEIAEQAETYAKETMDAIAAEYPDQLENARAAFNDFFASHNMPVSV